MAPSSLPITLDRASTLAHNFLRITQRISSTLLSSPSPPVLVAVSKLKPANDILFLHGRPPFSSSSSFITNADSATSNVSPQQPPESPLHDHFGENYTDELSAKSRVLPRSIKWHFIGQLQSNKCKALAEQVVNLWCVESVDSAKKADGLEKGRRGLAERMVNEREADRDESGGHENTRDHTDAPLSTAASHSTSSVQENGTSQPPSWEEPLRICIQVNTSGESSKAGVPTAEDAIGLYTHVRDNCPHLRVWGLMTIGAIARSTALEAGHENEDFMRLVETRDRVAEGVGIPKEDLRLSMGMSQDFESAIRCGSDEVRVGSDIFGERVKDRKEAKIVEDESTKEGE